MFYMLYNALYMLYVAFMLFFVKAMMTAMFYFAFPFLKKHCFKTCCTLQEVIDTRCSPNKCNCEHDIILWFKSDKPCGHYRLKKENKTDIHSPQARDN